MISFSVHAHHALAFGRRLPVVCYDLESVVLARYSGRNC